MIRLERTTCAQGCPVPALLLQLTDAFGVRIRGCGGPYRPGRTIKPSELTARERKLVEDAVAKASASRQISVDQAEAFLAEVFP